MPFKDRCRDLLQPNRSAAPDAVRCKGVAIVGLVPALEAAFAACALTQLTMCFSEFSHFCLETAFAATEKSDGTNSGTAFSRSPVGTRHAFWHQLAVSTRAAFQKNRGQEARAMVTLDWLGSTTFAVCLAGPPAVAVAFCRSFAQHHPEFSRIHRWPHRVILGVTAGDLIFSNASADGKRQVRAFGDPIERAQKLLWSHEHRTESVPHVIVCGTELDGLLHLLRSEPALPLLVG